MIKKKCVPKILIFVLMSLLFCSCKQKKALYYGQVYKIESKKYGYTISFKDKTIIKQENIPSLAENVTFKDSLDALKVMNFVVEKLNNNLSPSVNKQDLMNLNVIKKIE
jgi:Domain of unknown function (DUF4907)